MKKFVVATADNITTDITISELYNSEDKAHEELERQYKNAVCRFFCNGDETAEVDEDGLDEEDEMNLSDNSYSIYHSGSRDLEFAQILEIDFPDPQPVQAAILAAANLRALDHYSRSRAFSKHFMQMVDAHKDQYVHNYIGKNLLNAIQKNDLNAFIQALTGWSTEDVMAKAHIIPDINRVFSQEPVDATLHYGADYTSAEYTCKVDLSTHRVFDIFPVGNHSMEKGLEHGGLPGYATARVHFEPFGSFFCFSKEERNQVAGEVVYWYGEEDK